MGGTLSCGGRGHRPKDDDTRPYSAPVTKTNGIVAPFEKYIVPAGKFNALHAGEMFLIFCRLQIFFIIIFFQNILSGITDCQTVRTQIRPDRTSGLIWVQSVCKD